MGVLADPAGQAALMPLIVAAIALVRMVVPEVPNRLRPLIPILVALAIYVVFGPEMGWDTRTSILQGLMTGLGAAGLLRAGKVLVKNS